MSAVRHRLLAAAVTVPLLTGALGACGYGSEAKKDTAAGVAPKGAKTDGLDHVTIGFFGNTTHATPWSASRTARSRRNWAAPK